MTYSSYLEIKKMYLADECTVNHIAARLGISVAIARFVAQDWKESYKDLKQDKRVNAHDVRKQIGIKTSSGKRLVDLYKEGK